MWSGQTNGINRSTKMAIEQVRNGWSVAAVKLNSEANFVDCVRSTSPLRRKIWSTVGATAIKVNISRIKYFFRATHFGVVGCYFWCKKKKWKKN